MKELTHKERVIKEIVKSQRNTAIYFWIATAIAFTGTFYLGKSMTTSYVILAITFWQTVSFYSAKMGKLSKYLKEL